MTLEGKRDHLMEKQHMESFKIPKTFHWIRLFPRQHASVNITEVSVSWVPFEIIGLKLLVVKNRLQACKEFYKNNFWISFFFLIRNWFSELEHIHSGFKFHFVHFELFVCMCFRRNERNLRRRVRSITLSWTNIWTCPQRKKRHSYKRYIYKVNYNKKKPNNIIFIFVCSCVFIGWWTVG